MIWAGWWRRWFGRWVRCRKIQRLRFLSAASRPISLPTPLRQQRARWEPGFGGCHSTRRLRQLAQARLFDCARSMFMHRWQELWPRFAQDEKLLRWDGEVASADGGQVGIGFLAGLRWQRFAAHRVGIGRIGPEGADLDLLRLLRDEIVVEHALLVDVGGDDARGETAGELAMLSGFEEHANGDVGIAARSEADEPGVVFDGMGVAEFGGEGVAHGLGAASLAGEIDAFEMRAGIGAGGCGDECHGVGDGLPNGRIHGNGGIAGTGIGLEKGLTDFGPKLVGEDDMGAFERAARGDAGDGAHHLDGRGGDGALTDADRGDFAGIPLLMVVFHLPLGGGHGAGDFVGEVDAGFGAHSDQMSPLGDLVDAEAGGERVEEDVAGLIDGLVDIDCTVAAVNPAALIGAEEIDAAGAMDIHVLGDAFFESGEGHDDFESGTGGELGLDGLVHEGIFGIGDELVPLVAADADGELVGIEGGAADEGEDFAGVGIDGDHGAVAIAQGIFGGALDVEVDGEFETLAGFGGLGAEAADFAAMAVDDDVFRAVFAAQDAIVGGFDAGAADDIAGLIVGVARVVEHLFADFADVADQVGGESIFGIEAALLLDGVELGELVFVGLDELFFVGSDVLPEGERLVFGREAVALEDGVDLVDGHVEAAGDEGQVRGNVVALFADEEAGDGRVVVDEEAAFAVEDFAARSEDGDFADAVGFSEGVVVLSTDHLQAPETEDENCHDGRNDVLDDGEANSGQLFFAVEHGCGKLRGPQLAFKKRAFLFSKGVV